MEVVKIATDRIVVDASVRQTVHPEALEGLVSSIRELGILHPVLVIPDGERDNRGEDREDSDGEGDIRRYRLVAGYRRLLAAGILGETHVPAIILAADVNVRQVQLVENLQRADLNPVEKAMAVAAFMEEGGLSKSEAARRLGVPRTTLTDWLDILNVEPRFQRAVIDNFNGGDSPLTLSHISEARALAARLRSPHLATVLLDASLRYKLTKSEVREVARMVREQPNVSIRDAIRALREMQSALDDEEESESLGPAESNLLELMRVLHQSQRVMERMQHLTGRFIPPETREHLLEGFRRLERMARAAQARMLGVIDGTAPAEGAENGGTVRRRSGRATA